MAVDLLARIRAQQGSFAAADDLWRFLLKSDPGNHSARAGLARLALIRRDAARPAWRAFLLPLAILAGAYIVALPLIRSSGRHAQKLGRFTVLAVKKDGGGSPRRGKGVNANPTPIPV